jgi:hypothetical protein
MNILELEKFEIGTQFKKILNDDTIGKAIFIRNVNGISYEDAEEGEFICCDFQNLNSKFLEYKEYNKFIMGIKSKAYKLCSIFINSITEEYQKNYIIQKIKINEDIDILCGLNNSVFKDGSPRLNHWEDPEECVDIVCKLRKDSVIYFIYHEKSNCYYFYMNNIWHRTKNSINGEIIADVKKEKEKTFKFNYENEDYLYSSHNELYQDFLLKFDYDSVNIDDKFIEIDLRNGNFIKIKLL